LIVDGTLATTGAVTITGNATTANITINGTLDLTNDAGATVAEKITNNGTIKSKATAAAVQKTLISTPSGTGTVELSGAGLGGAGLGEGAQGAGLGGGALGVGGGWVVPGVGRGPAAGSAAGLGPGVAAVGWVRPALGAEAARVAAAVGGLEDVAELVAVVEAAAAQLGRRVGDGAGLGGPEVLDLVAGAIQASNAVGAAVAALVGAADRSGAASAATSTGLPTWLALKARLTRSEAQRLVLGARQAGPYPKLRRAALAGLVGQRQVEAASGVLRHLPPDLGAAQKDLAEEVVVGLAGQLAADQLAKAGEEVLERVAPQAAQQSAEDKAARQLRRAESKQFLAISDNFDGTATLRGLLPAAEAELVRAVIDKAAGKARRDHARSPGGPLPDRGRARAAALVEICRHAQSCAHAAPLGAAPARLLIAVQADRLARPGAGPGAKLAGTGQPLAAQAFNQLACDSEAMRVVLGAKGQVLDIGRATRVIPKGLRAALAARDQGCCFPGCDRPPELCEGHHVQPWHQGGTTSLSNLCLLCPAHHKMVEPPRCGPPAWQPRLRQDGHWEFQPPAHLDPDRKPLLHHRHKTRAP
ncbi:MAG: HNH endonuclease, partial [Bifidobacteriaceae bacterium]|nr:HNH endonuclease [Bifidobacteriaceae bacterium]